MEIIKIFHYLGEQDKLLLEIRDVPRRPQPRRFVPSGEPSNGPSRIGLCASSTHRRKITTGSSRGIDDDRVQRTRWHGKYTRDDRVQLTDLKISVSGLRLVAARREAPVVGESRSNQLVWIISEIQNTRLKQLKLAFYIAYTPLRRCRFRWSMSYVWAC